MVSTKTQAVLLDDWCGW